MLNADRYDPCRVTTSEPMDVFPQWSPDGARIAFTSRQGDHKHVWVVDADGTNLERVTSGPAGTENGLATRSPAGDTSTSSGGPRNAARLAMTGPRNSAFASLRLPTTMVSRLSDADTMRGDAKLVWSIDTLRSSLATSV